MDPLILITGTLGVLAITGVALMPAMQRAPYAYGNARIRARRSELYSDDSLRELARSEHLDIVYRLERTGFRGLLALESVGFREEEVQQLLRTRYYDRLREIRGFVPASDRAFFEALLSLSDYEFIITVLRSKTNPYYDRSLLENLIVDSDVFSTDEVDRMIDLSLDDTLVRLRGTPYQSIIEPHLSDIKAGKLSAFEKDANDAYYHRLLSAAGTDRVLKGFALREIDALNVRTALCFEGQEMVDAGILAADVRARLVTVRSVEELVRVLSGTYLEPFVSHETKQSGIVRGVLRAQRAYARSVSRDALGIGVVLLYYMDQRIELRNLRIILKLVHARFEPDIIEEAII